MSKTAIEQHLDTAFSNLFELQNDETAAHARDSNWHRQHDDKLADTMESVRAARATLPQETSDAENN